MKNAHQIIGNVVFIRLDRKDGTTCWTKVDKWRLCEVANHRWRVLECGKTQYAQSDLKKRQGSLLMHRLLMGLQKGDPRQVDHKDHNGLNNLESNIHVVTRAENQHNQRGKQQKSMSIRSSSKYPGVSWRKRDNLWEVKIQSCGKSIFLGHHNLELEAAKTYIKAKKIRDAGGTFDEIRKSRNSRKEKKDE